MLKKNMPLAQREIIVFTVRHAHCSTVRVQCMFTAMRPYAARSSVCCPRALHVHKRCFAEEQYTCLIDYLCSLCDAVQRRGIVVVWATPLFLELYQSMMNASQPRILCAMGPYICIARLSALCNVAYLRSHARLRERWVCLCDARRTL